MYSLMSLIPFDTTDSSSGSLISILAIYAVFGFAIYFFMFRPQSKKRKKEAAVRSSAQVGDQIITIGGVMGRIIAIRDDSDAVIIETGSDRTKLLVKRWAIGTVETLHDDV